MPDESGPGRVHRTGPRLGDSARCNITRSNGALRDRSISLSPPASGMKHLRQNQESRNLSRRYPASLHASASNKGAVIRTGRGDLAP